jgi:hypothetical protein
MKMAAFWVVAQQLGSQPCYYVGARACQSPENLPARFSKVFRTLVGGGGGCKAIPSRGQHNTQSRRHTSMPRVEFEPTVPLLEQPEPTS